MERLCGKQHAFVEARQLDIDATVAQELNRRKMQSIERADDDRKWFERSGEKLGIEFDEIDAAEQFAHRIMETREPARVNSIPTSYSSNRLDTSCSFQNESGTLRGSTKTRASATELSR